MDERANCERSEIDRRKYRAISLGTWSKEWFCKGYWKI